MHPKTFGGNQIAFQDKELRMRFCLLKQKKKLY